jgi:hypothetical protein
MVGSEEELGSMELVKIGNELLPACGRITADEKNIRIGYVIHLTAVKICTNTENTSIISLWSLQTGNFSLGAST